MINEERTISSLPNRVNCQPVIFRGMTFNELVFCIGGGLAVLLPLSIIIMSFFGKWMIGIALGVVLDVLLFFILSITLQRLKRNRGSEEVWLMFKVKAQQKLGVNYGFNLFSGLWHIDQR